jgi:hypothetical protein
MQHVRHWPGLGLTGIGSMTAAVAAGQLEQRRELSGRIGISVFTHTLIQLGMLANLV